MGALLAAGGCATAPSAPDPIVFGRTQTLALRTEPPGATCTLTQAGKVVATVEATPGDAVVPRDFKWSRYGIEPPADAIPPLKIVCRKAGYVDYRRDVPVQFLLMVLRERAALKARPEPAPADTAKGAAALAGTAGAAALMAAPAASGPLGMALAASGGAVLAPVAAVAVVGIIATKDIPPKASYAYRPLPEFLLVPSEFDSPASCDAFFADLEAQVRTVRDRTRAQVDANCRFHPCQPTDAQPCQDPFCQLARERADEDLHADLERIAVMRGQVRVGAANERAPGE